GGATPVGIVGVGAGVPHFIGNRGAVAMIVIAVGHRGSAAQAGRGIMDHYNLMPSVVFHEGTVGSARAAGTAVRDRPDALQIVVGIFLAGIPAIDRVVFPNKPAVAVVTEELLSGAGQPMVGHLVIPVRIVAKYFIAAFRVIYSADTAARIARVSRGKAAFVPMAEEPVVKAVWDPAVVLRIRSAGIYPIENLVGAIGGDMMDFGGQAAAVSVLPGASVKGGNDRFGLDPASIPDLVGLALEPVLPIERKVCRQRILIGEIRQLDQLVAQVFAGALVTGGIAKIKHPPAVDPVGFHSRPAVAVDGETGDGLPRFPALFLGNGLSQRGKIVSVKIAGRTFGARRRAVGVENLCHCSGVARVVGILQDRITGLMNAGIISEVKTVIVLGVGAFRITHSGQDRPTRATARRASPAAIAIANRVIGIIDGLGASWAAALDGSDYATRPI